MTPRLDAIGLVVRDLDASIAFYERLGLGFPDATSGDGHVESMLPGGVRLMIDSEATVRRFDPGWTPPSGGHRVALAFRCADPGDVDSTYSTLLAAGATSHLAPFDAFWGQRYATVLDPDGNAVDLFAPLAG